MGLFGKKKNQKQTQQEQQQTQRERKIYIQGAGEASGAFCIHRIGSIPGNHWKGRKKRMT